MRLHPLHPASVHAPIGCIVLTPLADLAAFVSGRAEVWTVGAFCAGGSVAFGAVAAMFGAVDFDRGHAKAAKIVTCHAALMLLAIIASGVSLAGRVGVNFGVYTPAPALSVGASLGALALVLVGGFLGGEMVYGRGVGVCEP